MAVSRALRRVLRVRELEEEQRRLALEAASADLNKLRGAMKYAIDRAHRGRQLIALSAASGELPDRLSGVEEIRTSERFVLVLTPRIAEQEQVVAERRQEYMEKRLERRQAETLIEESKAREELEAGRRAQMALDDWFSNKLYREGGKQKPRSVLAVEEERLATPIQRHPADDIEKKSIDLGKEGEGWKG
jgi:flagellar biosynthesis chaperone FliJ